MALVTEPGGETSWPFSSAVIRKAIDPDAPFPRRCPPNRWRGFGDIFYCSERRWHIDCPVVPRAKKARCHKLNLIKEEAFYGGWK